MCSQGDGVSLSKGGRTPHTTGSSHSSGGGGGGSGGERVVLLSPTISSKPAPPATLTPVAVALVVPAGALALPLPEGEDGGEGVDDIPEPDDDRTSGGVGSNRNGACAGTGIDNNGDDTSAIGGSASASDGSASGSASGRSSGAERLRSSRSSYSFKPPGTVEGSAVAYPLSRISIDTYRTA